MVVAASELTIIRGAGAEVWDDAGRRYIDCVAGHGSANLGHCHPAVVRAITEQASRLITCPPSMNNDVRHQLTRRLAEIMPTGEERGLRRGEERGLRRGEERGLRRSEERGLRRSEDRFFLCNSGAEAVEAALKAARLATGRAGIIAARRGFHGRTFGALSATWEKRYREPFEPLVPGVRFVPFDDVAALEAAIDDTVGLVILEPVQGEGGVHPASPGYLQAVSELCRRRGALLAIDEVQTGFGRTGVMFACQTDGIVPDLLCMAKSIAGGVPMGALALGPGVPSFPSGAHGSTFGGNPLACAAAIAAIGALVDEDLPARALAMGAYLSEGLNELRSPSVRAIRGRGLMIGVELRDRARPVVEALRAHGVLALTAGMTVLRLLPPLVISRSQCDEVVDAIHTVLLSGPHSSPLRSPRSSPLRSPHSSLVDAQGSTT